MAGTHFYRQIEDLAMSICVAKKISDAEWRAFLSGSVRLSQHLGHHATVSITGFVHAFPSPLQRRITIDFLQKSKVPVVERMALVSDSSFVRGAIIALNLIIPKAKVRSFNSRDVVTCLNWLREIGQFDVPTATEAWHDGRTALGLK